jgi:hypothetical protein
MTIYRIKLNWIIGSLVILIFAILLILRLGILEEGEAEYRGGPILNVQNKTNRETWMNIFQQGEKIGYAHRQFYKTAEGYRITESVFMQINLMGMLQDIRLKTDGNFHSDLTLSSFDFELLSGLFRFKARGVLKGKMLTLLTGTSRFEQKIDLPLEKEIYLSLGILEVFTHQDLRPGDSRTFHVFDPTTMIQRPVKISFLAEETIPIMGRQEKAKKVSVEFMGVPQFAWVGKDGTVLKEEGFLGIRLEQVRKEDALDKMTFSKGADLAEIFSIPSNKILHDVDQLKELRLKLDGIEKGAIFLNGGRQSLQGSVLTIRKESVSNLASSIKEEKIFPGREKHLESTPLIQANHPEIQAKVKEIVSRGDPVFRKAEKLVRWINENIQKRPVLSVPNAYETLQNRVGDCNEHAVLLAALARASGIPAQVEAGLVYQGGRFYYHAWNVLHLGTWITADSVMGQLPTDVTHIRFVRGTERQIDLVRIIGRVRIEILSSKHEIQNSKRESR